MVRLIKTHKIVQAALNVPAGEEISVLDPDNQKSLLLLCIFFLLVLGRETAFGSCSLFVLVLDLRVLGGERVG